MLFIVNTPFYYYVIMILTMIAILIHMVAPFEMSCSDHAKYAGCMAEADPGLFVLSQFWMPQKVNRWIIHGLWINYCNGSMIEYCSVITLPTRNISNLLIENKRPDLLEGMRYYWNPDEDYNDLWLHELEKHASCMRTLQPECHGSNPIQGWIDYFDSSIQLYLKYPIYEILMVHGVVPGNYYASDTIKRVLSDTWNTTISLQCEEDVLSEVFLYFYAKGPISRVDFRSTQLKMSDMCNGIVFYPNRPIIIIQ